MEPTKEDLWNVLYADLTLNDRIELLRPGAEGNQAFVDAAKEGGPWKVQSLSLTLKQMAYMRLVKIGEISDTEIVSVIKREGPVHGDYGFKGPFTYRYSGGEWRFAY